MVDVRFELTTTTHGPSTTPFVKALLIVRWATGKRSSNRLSKLPGKRYNTSTEMRLEQSPTVNEVQY